MKLTGPRVARSRQLILVALGGSTTLQVQAPLIVEAPLRGEWVALHTPGERVPSHGTNYLGQRFAYDFIQSHPRSKLPYERGLWRHVFAYQPAESFLCWDEPVYSVFAGDVVSVGTGWRDRKRVNLVLALTGAVFAAPRIIGNDIRPLAGNYVIVRGATAVAFYAHLRAGTVAVSSGQKIRVGDLIGRVGNSGNSTMPHLHFHLMDSSNILEAEGIPCCFRVYERLEGQTWTSVHAGIPGKLERIRWMESA